MFGRENVDTGGYIAAYALIDERTSEKLSGQKQSYNVGPTNLPTSEKVVELGRSPYRCKYYLGRCEISVHACYRLSRSKRTIYLSRDVVIGNEIQLVQTSHTLPVGWYWDCSDANLSCTGIRIVQVDNDDIDYHLTSDDWYRLQLPRDDEYSYELILVRFAERNYEKRRQGKLREGHREQILELCRRGLIGVTVADSIQSGNCAAGTAEFCRRLNLDETVPLASIDARILLRTKNDRAVSAAVYAGFRLTEVMI